MRNIVAFCNELLQLTPISLTENAAFDATEKYKHVHANKFIAEIDESFHNDPSLLSSNPIIHNIIADLVFEKCLDEKLSVRAAAAFSEWFAELLTGWSTRYSNELDVMKLNEVFGEAAFNDPLVTVRVYLAPSIDDFKERFMRSTQIGVKVVYETAKEQMA